MTEEQKRLFYQQLGENIRVARENSALTQSVLASFLGLSRASIVNIEKGRQRPSIDLLFSLSRILNSELSELIPAFQNIAKFESENIELDWMSQIRKSFETAPAQQLEGDHQAEKILGFIKEITLKSGKI
jgi:transcriptional regulator with XRE-family HTH domain